MILVDPPLRMRLFWRWSQVFVALALVAAALSFARPALAASIPVTTTADTLDAAGTCETVTLASLPGPNGVTSLREAICAANANAGADIITFNIDNTVFGAAPHIINVTSALPDITGQVTINGLSEPDVAGGICPLPSGALAIQINGASAGGGVDGLRLFGGNAGSSIRGLSITNFSDDAIELDATSNTTITCSSIGLAADGTTSGANSYGINLNGAANNTIGGPAAGDRNVLAHNIFFGILNDGSGNTARGNIIRNNGLDGIAVGAGTGNRFSQNRIYSNGAAVIDIGIELGQNGVTPNDAGDADTGTNNRQNFPVISAVTSQGTNTVVGFTLDSHAGN